MSRGNNNSSSNSPTFFSALEISEAVRDISRTAKHHRLNNFYDVGARSFVMRFGAADSKYRVAFEPGTRIHLTDVEHEKPKLPSHFTLLIRRHIKGWRLFSVSQLGRDRVVDFAFGTDAPLFHVFVELWGQGNIVLADAECKIVAFWRTPRKSDAGASTSAAPKQIGDVYADLSAAEESSGSPAAAGAAGASPATSPTAALLASAASALTEANILAALQSLRQKQQQPENNSKEKGPPVGSVFPSISAIFGPSLIKHISLSCAVDFSKPLPATAHIETLARHLARAFAEVEAAYGPASAPGGYVFCKKTETQQPQAPKSDPAATSTNSSTAASTEAAAQDKATVEKKSDAMQAATTAAVEKSNAPSKFHNVVGFSKILLKQFTLGAAAANFVAVPTATFSAAADALFAEEDRKKLHDITKKQPTAELREVRVRQSIQRRITELQSESAQRRRCANALLMCADDVDRVVQLIGDALALGTPWKMLTDAIRRQREAAAEQKEKQHQRLLKKNKSDASGGGGGGGGAGNDDDDDSDGGGNLFGSDHDDDDEGSADVKGGDLFVDEDEEADDSDSNHDEEEEEEDDDERRQDESDDDDGAHASNKADEQRFLLSLIYALDLRRNQMTLQLPDPEAAFEDDETNNNNNDDDDNEAENDYAGSEQTILVVVDLNLSCHENATKYFEAAKKADTSRSKTAEKEEDAVANAKKTSNKGSHQKQQQQKKAAANIPKQILAAERTPAWFERHLWFISSAGDLVVAPKDASAADVLMTKFASMEYDAVVMHDGGDSSAPVWPTLIKTRAGAINLLKSVSAEKQEGAAATSSSSSSPVKISLATLREAGAAAVCRSAGWNQKSAPKAYWCAAAALTKIAPGTRDKILPQGQWFAPNETRTPLEVFSLQLCVAVVEALSAPLPESEFEPVSDSGEPLIAARVGLLDKAPKSSPASPATASAGEPGFVASSAASAPASSASSQQQKPPQSKPHGGGGGKQPVAAPPVPAQLSKQAAKQQQRKAAKIQKKYGEQDEDDRAIALALIGTTKSKAHDLLEQNKKKREDDNDNDDDDEDANESADVNNSNISSAAAKSDDKNAAAKESGDCSQQQHKQPPLQQSKTKNVRVGGGKAGGGTLTEDASKNLTEKIVSAAQEWLSMRVVGTSHCTSAPLVSENNNNNNNNNNADDASNRHLLVRYVSPVCMPVLAMPTNKVRVLIVPGGEKRNGLAAEISKSFLAALAAHVAAPLPSLSAALTKIPSDDLLQQLPMTAKIQTPFRASMVPILGAAGAAAAEEQQSSTAGTVGANKKK